MGAQSISASKRSKRDGLIDFMKFIFAVIMVFCHGGPFFHTGGNYVASAGFIGVEFFFIVSGYLLTARAAKGMQEDSTVLDENLKMLRGKILHFFPFLLLACLASNVFSYVRTIPAPSLEVISHNLLYTTTDLLGLQMFGFPGFYATGVAWYISALLAVSFLIYPILCKKRELFTKYIAPVSVMLIMGYTARVGTNLGSPGDWWTIVFKGMLRGYADIAIGCMAFEFAKWLNTDKGKEKCGTISLSLLEIVGFIVVIGYALFHRGSSGEDFFVLPLLFFSVGISFSGRNRLSEPFSNPVFYFLGELSFSIYLNHFFVRGYLITLYPDVTGLAILMTYLSIVLVLALLNFFVGKLLCRYVINSIPKVITTVLLVWGVSLLLYFVGTL